MIWLVRRAMFPVAEPMGSWLSRRMSATSADRAAENGALSSERLAVGGPFLRGAAMPPCRRLRDQLPRYAVRL